MTSGSGKITINNRNFEDYFPTISLQNNVIFPLQVANATQSFDVEVTATGGGTVGQVGAVRLGIARALLKTNQELRPDLKSAGLLRRDPRAKERKKAGQPGARKRFQFSKR